MNNNQLFNKWSTTNSYYFVMVSSIYANTLKYHISRYANKHFITGVYITINDSYREVNMEIQVKFIKSKNIRINRLTFNKKKIVYLYKNAEFIRYK
jgi:hypothetical protein